MDGQMNSGSSGGGSKGALIAVLVVLVIVLVGALMYFIGKSGNPAPSATEQTPAAGPTPVGQAPSPTTMGQAPSPTPSQAAAGRPAATPTPRSTPAPSASVTVPPPALDASFFAGNWNGTYSPNSLAGKNCKGGTVNFDIKSNGTIAGTIQPAGSSYRVPGTASVDAGGNLKGSWSLAGVSVSFTGKLSGNSGNGSYLDNLGCFGGFSVGR